MVKYLFKITKLVNERKFEPRPFVSKLNLLSPYDMLVLLLKNTKMMRKTKKEKEEEGKWKEEEWKKEKNWTRAQDTYVYLRESNGTFECCLSVSIQSRLN